MLKFVKIFYNSHCWFNFLLISNASFPKYKNICQKLDPYCADSAHDSVLYFSYENSFKTTKDSWNAGKTHFAFLAYRARDDLCQGGHYSVGRRDADSTSELFIQCSGALRQLGTVISAVPASAVLHNGSFHGNRSHRYHARPRLRGPRHSNTQPIHTMMSTRDRGNVLIDAWETLLGTSSHVTVFPALLGLSPFFLTISCG